MLAVTAKAGIAYAGAKELTCLAYIKKFSQPEDCCPHKFIRLATADKKPKANASLTSKAAIS